MYQAANKRDDDNRSKSKHVMWLPKIKSVSYVSDWIISKMLLNNTDKSDLMLELHTIFSSRAYTEQ